MSAYTVSSVHADTDQLTIIWHGLQTGDGAVVLFAPEGDYPGGTSGGQAVWVIRVNEHVIQLASSLENALAGVAIDITSTGSGTLELRLRWDAAIGEARYRAPLEIDLNPFQPGDAWQVASGSLPSWRLAGSHPAVTIAANSSVYYPLRIGHTINAPPAGQPIWPRIRGVVVYGRAFDGVATLSLCVSSGMNSDTESLSVVTLAGDGPDGPTLPVASDGLYAPRALVPQTPLQPIVGEMLFLRINTDDGVEMDVLSYGLART
jgi:hypothetical protein